MIGKQSNVTVAGFCGCGESVCLADIASRRLIFNMSLDERPSQEAKQRRWDGICDLVAI